MSSLRTQRASAAHALVWHELECGAYEADLALWLELADRARSAVLDVGAGSGRVTLALARAGHHVAALEREPMLLEALRESAADLPVEGVLADARDFTLERRDFGLCVVPMHTVQLFGGADSRAAFLRCARAHLRPRGTLAIAILPDAEPFDCTAGQIGPVPESTCVEGLRFVSVPTRVAVEAGVIVIERERRVRALSGDARGDVGSERDRVELARLSAEQMHEEALAAGFTSEDTREVPATDEHVGSEVVIVRA